MPGTKQSTMHHDTGRAWLRRTLLLVWVKGVRPGGGRQNSTSRVAYEFGFSPFQRTKCRA